MSTLDKFQAATSRALNDPSQQSPETVLGRETDGTSRRFNIYRNNRAGSLIDALSSTYPVLYRLLGDAFFRAAARQFIDVTPPKGPVLSEYGYGFGAFVQRLPGTSNFPYLADVSELEWRRLQSYHAANDLVLTPNALQSIEPTNLVGCRLKRHSAAALVESQWAVGSVWANSQGSEAGGEPGQLNISQAEAVLITRPRLDVQLQLLSFEGAFFLKHLFEGLTIAEAATHCLTQSSEFDTGTHLQGLIGMGVFSEFLH